ncbi:2,3-butanediol dehydrogenase [Streptomyces olivoreticuli]|uniref:2,3-butanediol dehydrogenase n=1 Tax=Streptomyces olivoreticuli TaxID=68246 RepID=UPI00265B467A|nr:2,3-butanediol dehydrogenase [Streptomyces olivoreticuli]WKK23975.1 2,3-butanediol dehydrogenase [Streptomyces olivoreticuli]
MKALRLHAPQELRLDDIPEPELRPGTVKIAVEWAGVCGSDLHAYHVGPVGSRMDGKPHPVTGESGPRVLGHEFAGRVEEFADDVTFFEAGDPVAVEPILYDGTCVWCRRGDYNLCDQMGFAGLDGWGGGFSEKVVLPAHMAHKLPGNIGTDTGALVEPLAVGWGAMHRSGIRAGQTALVLGGGPVGLAVLLALRAAGAGYIAVSEPGGARAELAERFGADRVLDPTAVDAAATVRAATGGLGVHAAFDTAGFKSTLDTGLAAIRKHGSLVNLALWEHQVEIDPMSLLLSEGSYTASNAYGENIYPAVIAALGHGALRPEKMITKRVALDDAVKEAFGTLLDPAGAAHQVKLLVHP